VRIGQIKRQCFFRRQGFVAADHDTVAGLAGQGGAHGGPWIGTAEGRVAAARQHHAGAAKTCQPIE